MDSKNSKKSKHSKVVRKIRTSEGSVNYTDSVRTNVLGQTVSKKHRPIANNESDMDEGAYTLAHLDSQDDAETKETGKPIPNVQRNDEVGRFSGLRRCRRTDIGFLIFTLIVIGILIYVIVNKSASESSTKTIGK